MGQFFLRQMAQGVELHIHGYTWHWCKPGKRERWFIRGLNLRLYGTAEMYDERNHDEETRRDED